MPPNDSVSIASHIARRPPGYIELPTGGKAEDFLQAERLVAAFNAAPAGAVDEQLTALRALLGGLGEGARIKPPLLVDYGFNIHLDAGAFVNSGAVMLDVAPIRIGARTLIGPRVQLLTPAHPLNPDERQHMWGGAAPITIGANVWLGGGVIVCPGVTIGDHAVVGAGSVVTRDIPEAVLAVGNPARVIRSL